MSRENFEEDEFEEEIDEKWEILLNHDDYEINRETLQIRKRSSHRILKETFSKGNGYIIITLNKKHYLKHRLIALQFIPNPDNLPFIDHMNHDRTDNRISNIRWVSHLQNDNNRRVGNNNRIIEYVQELPDDVLVVNQYGKYHFENYYFANDVFYKDTGNGDYRIIPWHLHNKQGNWKVALVDVNSISRTISKNVFYKIYGLD